MTKRTVFRQADVARAIRGAIAGGLPPGTFRIDIEADRISVVTLPTALSSAEDCARRMREAFGDPDPAEAALERARRRAELSGTRMKARVKS